LISPDDCHVMECPDLSVVAEKMLLLAGRPVAAICW
jgi:hypothetical protein